jgi:hypothetical protein
MTTEQVLALVRKLNRLQDNSPDNHDCNSSTMEFTAIISQSEDQINLGPYRLNDFDTDEETEEGAIWSINDKLNDLKAAVDSAKWAVERLIYDLEKGKRKPAFIPVNSKAGKVKPKFFQEKK